MATAKNKTEDKPATNAQPPEGFAELSYQIDGWCKMEKDLVVYGKVVGHMSMKDNQTGGTRKAALVKVRQETKAISAEDKETVITLNKGDILAVGISYALRPILDYVEHQGDVWFRVLGKKKLDGGKTTWKVDLRAKGKKAPLVETQVVDTAPQQTDTTDFGDDIPF